VDEAQVEIQIRVEPADAIATLDGMRIATPMSARFPRDRVARSLRVEAPGYVGQTSLVVFDRDQALSIALASASPPPSAMPSATSNGSASSTQRPVARPRPSATATGGVTPPIVDDRDPWAPKPR
jgi:hypothetical protein